MKITVNWTIMPSGSQVQDQYPSRAPLHAIKHMVLAEADDASPRDAKNYKVLNMNREELDESKSLDDLEITDGTRLVLQPA